MAVTRDILTRAAEILQDRDNVRWPLTELAAWANDGVRAIVLAKPSASSQSIIVQLSAGTLQGVPSASGSLRPMQLLDIPRNLSSGATPRIGKRSIKKCERRWLDAHYPSWHDSTVFTQAKEVKHYVFDDQNPLEFYVFPGNDGTGFVEAVVSVLPAPLTYTGQGMDIANYSADVALPEIYTPVLLDYVLFRAYSKDDLGANAGRSQFHFQQFAAAVGLRTQVEAATNPTAAKPAA